jgi:hypothetical protein
MSTHEHLVAISVRSASGFSRILERKPLPSKPQTLRGTARDALFAYAMTGARSRASPSSQQHIWRCCRAAPSMAEGERAGAARGAFRG